MFRRNVVLVILAVNFGVAGYSQTKTKVTADTNPSSGVEMYRAYCAVCHGLDGKGAGPAAPAMKLNPTDLTQLSKKNGGEFPMFHVSNIIQGDAAILSHGTREMPLWGDVFRNLKRDESVVKLRVHNLAQYIESLQQK